MTVDHSRTPRALTPRRLAPACVRSLPPALGSAALTLALTTLGACGGDGGLPSAPPGDPALGRDYLLNRNYVHCGMPLNLTKAGLTQLGDGLQRLLIPGRTGENATLPYFLTAGQEGPAQIAAPNCLSCHASALNGEIVVGLGASVGEFTGDQRELISFADGLVPAAELPYFEKFASRARAMAPHTRTTRLGTNPADNFTGFLFAHHDPETMAWSDTPLLPEPPLPVVEVDVPAWWHAKKKTALYYLGAGVGDHSRAIQTAMILCTDTNAELEAQAADFAHILAFIRSIEAPKYPGPVDAQLAERGRGLFETTCARCHGTYGEAWTYPNRVVPFEEIGTDPLLGTTGFQSGQYTDWFNRSWFGERARLEPQDGYIAPPLDGIWASAPYFHNASVPTVADVLSSTTRPRYWQRTFRSDDLDPARLGWRYRTLDHGHAGEPDPDKRIYIYDTTTPGHSNAGHTFGDDLTEDERAAVLEYLKTL